MLRRSQMPFSVAVLISVALLLRVARWLTLVDCGVGGVDDTFSPRAPLPPFPVHERARELRRDTLSPVDVVYVTAFPRHAASSLRSLCYFADVGAVGTVHLIVPDRMADFFKSDAVLAALQCPRASAWKGAQAPTLRFAVWAESTLVRAFAPGGASWSGTTRQMTLKLAAARFVTSPFYLVMDSDVYARQRFSRADLFDASGTRARADVDQNDFCQPATWYNQASRVLASRLVADTNAYCAHLAAAAGYSAVAPNDCPPADTGLTYAPSWFASTLNASVPANPFALILDEAADGGSHQVFGACRAARSHASHVTPMILARAIVLDVLAPRLESLDAARTGSPEKRAPKREWLDVLLDFHAERAATCRQGSSGRFYSWTEYALYFVAGVASHAMGQYHSFSERGITSIEHSMMKPVNYERANWAAIFNDNADKRPFFIVHSWFGKPIEETDAHMAPFVPTLAFGALDNFPPMPSPAPLW